MRILKAIKVLALAGLFISLLCLNSYASDTQDLIDAAGKGNVSTVKTLLAKGEQVHKIILKSGKEWEGKLIQKTSDTFWFDINGEKILFLPWELESIDGEKVISYDLGNYDERQRQIIEQATDNIIEKIKALKGTYPELAKFGEEPYFVKGFGSFGYFYHVEEKEVPAETDMMTNRVLKYMKQITPLPGGGAIVFRFYQDRKDTWKIPHFSGCSTASGYTLAQTEFENGKKGIDACPLFEVIRTEIQRSFDAPWAEDELQKMNLKVNPRDLISYLDNPDPVIVRKAALVLNSKVLNKEELADFTAMIMNDQLSPAAVLSILGMIEKQDAESAFEIYLHLLDKALEAEKTGKDVHERTPFFYGGQISYAQSIRSRILEQVAKTKDPRYIPMLKKIFVDETMDGMKIKVLQALSEFPKDEIKDIVVKSLSDPSRKIREQGLKIVKEKNLVEAANQLKDLLSSYNSAERLSAKEILDTLNIKYAEPGQKNILPSSALKIAEALWSVGLEEQDILKSISIVHRIKVSCNDDPAKKTLPPGYRYEKHGAGCVMYNPLGSYWFGGETNIDTVEEAKTLNLPTLKESAEVFLNPREDLVLSDDEKYQGCDMINEGTAGPYLLAAAVKLDDKQLALAIYEKLNESYDKDEQILQKALDALAWKNFLVAIDAFQAKNDKVALDALAQLKKFVPFIQSQTMTDGYLKQAQAIEESIIKSKEMASLPEPPPTEQEAYIKYLVKKIKEINGRQDMQPGAPSIFSPYPSEEDLKGDMAKYWQKRIKQLKEEEGIEGPFASDMLKKIGIKALPALVEVFPDETYTRTVGYHRDFMPSRYIVSVSGAARKIFTVICYDYGLLPPEFMKDKKDLSIKENFVEFKKNFDTWYAQIPEYIKKLSPSDYQKFMNGKVYKGQKSFPFVDAP